VSNGMKKVVSPTQFHRVRHIWGGGEGGGVRVELSGNK
jgi:hypothetical protein